MDTRWTRLARGWLTAAVSVVVAAVSHVAGGGTLPGLLGAVLAFTFAGLVSVALAGKSLSLVRLSLSVLASQIAFHVLFSVGTGAPVASLTGQGMAHQHGATMLDVASAGGSASPLPAGSSMWLAHAAAALVTIVILRRGETSFWGMLDLARTILVAVFLPLDRVICPASIEPVRLRLVLGDRSGLRDLVVLRAGRSLRGPPASV